MRRETEIPTATGWFVDQPAQAEAMVSGGQVDLVMLARAELSDPNWTYHAAQALGRTDPQTILPPQYAYWLRGR